MLFSGVDDPDSVQDLCPDAGDRNDLDRGF
jgi:hypothetical protein